MAQSYYFKRYTVQNGLPSDIIKGVQQDSSGFLWIATDEGVAKYDGVNFTNYPEIATSNYMKGFIKTKDGRHILYGDLDIYEVVNNPDSTKFYSLYPTSRVQNNSAINYPKAIFEDKNQKLWISEPQSVVRLDRNGFQRFDFGIENRTTQFLRSFSLFEDKVGDLYTCSFQGNLFKYDPKDNKFQQIAIGDFPESIEFIKVFGEQLIIGAAQGVFVSKLLESGGFDKPTLKRNVTEVSYVEKIGENQFFIASRGKEHFISDTTFTLFKPLSLSIDNINHVYMSDEKDVWISCNDGLILMRENLFQKVGSSNVFIESLAQVENSDSVYYATNLSLFTYNKATKNSSAVMIDFPGGYHQALLHTNQGLWIANAFNVYLYRNNEKIKEYDFSYQPRFASELTKDKYGNIWVTVINDRYAHKISPDLSIRKYSIALEELGVINNILEGPDGMYLASSGNESYLYYKSDEDTIFKNISIPLNGNSSIEVTSLAFHKNDIYLASSIGLLKYDRKTISTVNLGSKFSNLPIRAMKKYGENELLFSNAFGLVRYSIANGVVDLFNESYGLPSRSISTNGIYVGKKQDVWVATSKGLCYSPLPLTQTTKTKTPMVIEKNIDGEPIKEKEMVADYGSLLQFIISAITFPENDVNYQYKLDNDEWINSSNEIILSGLNRGKHTLTFRAKKYGPFNWSNTKTIDFIVLPPYWQKPLFIIGIVGFALLMVLIIYATIDYQNRQKQQKLQHLINEKTSELKAANENLQRLNDEKNNLMQIVAHDLKSPLSQIIGLVDLMKDDKEFALSDQSLDMITTSTTNLSEMISKILDVRKVEKQDLNINIRAVNISETFLEIINRYNQQSKDKRITIHKDLTDAVHAMVDVEYVRQVFDNLISNALKFSPSDSKIFISLKKENDRAILMVKDEGPGLTPQDKQKLFNKFQKLSAKPTGNESSTGLGLSIVKRFVSLMAGEIWVESEAGKGASFFVAFKTV